MPRTEAANQRIREQRREKILAGAASAFARKGKAATMADVASAAGVSQGLAYRYFADKEALFRALIEDLMHPALATMEHLRDVPSSPGKRLATLISMLVHGRREHPEFFQLLSQVLGDDEMPADLRERVERQNQVFQDVLKQLIVEGQRSGEIAQGDPDQLVTIVVAWLDGLSRLPWSDPERFQEHFPDVELFLRIFSPASGQ